MTFGFNHLTPMEDVYIDFFFMIERFEREKKKRIEKWVLVQERAVEI